MFETDQRYFQTFTNELEAVKAGEQIDEDIIYNNYQAHLASDTPIPFEGFSKENRDMLLRLKFRSINSRIPGFGGGPHPEVWQPQQLKAVVPKPLEALKEILA